MTQQKKLAPLPVKQSFHEGWRIFKENFWFLVGVFVFMFLVNIFFGGVEDASRDRAALSAVAQVVSAVVLVFLQLGLISIMLSLVDGKLTRWGDLFSQSKLILPYILASILFSIGAAVGLILLVVPGVIFLLTFQLYSFSIVDHRLSVLESLRQSATLTRGYRWGLFQFMLLSILLNIAGLLLFGIGLLITMPVTSLAHVYLYRFLSKRFAPQEEDKEEVEDPLPVTQTKPQTLTSDEEA